MSIRRVPAAMVFLCLVCRISAQVIEIDTSEYLPLLNSGALGYNLAQAVEIDTSEYLPLFYSGALEYNLMIAASKGYYSEVERMILMGADIEAETTEGATPLFFAISNNHSAVVNILLRHGADVNKKAGRKETPLLLSVRKQNIEIAEALIRNGAEINDRDAYGATALHYASIYGYFDFVDLLLYYKADVDLKANDGTSPLMAAIWAGYADIAKLLIRNGANMEARDNKGFTPFLIAAQNGDTLMLNFLHKNGVDIYEKNIYNWDALGLTIKSDQIHATEMLLKAGNKWTDPDRDVVNPYNIAARYRRKEIINYLNQNDLSGKYQRRFDQMALSVSAKFDLRDFYSGFNFAFKEPLSNLGIIAGFDTKFWYTKILVQNTESFFYQYFDKSSIVYAGVYKDMPLTDNLFRSNFYFTASLSAGYYFGNKFKGTEIAPGHKLKILPSATFKWIKGNFILFSGIEYMNSDYYKIGPLWGRIGCSVNFYFNNVKAPGKTIRWY